MAFMMPVMKNNFDIYKSGRSRRTSECSNTSQTCSSVGGGGVRSRKISECSRSECPSLSTSPGNDYISGVNSPAHRSHPMQMNRLISRQYSRTSQNSLITSPTKSSTGCSPPKPSTSSGSQGSLNKFHTRLVDKLKKSLRRSGSGNNSSDIDGATASS